MFIVLNSQVESYERAFQKQTCMSQFYKSVPGSL